MKEFNKEEKIRELMKAFEATDEFYAKFKTKFKVEILLLIHQYYPQIDHEAVIDYIIDVYTNEIISSTESVLDKDENYPDYRKQEELVRISSIVNKEPQSKEIPEFIAKSHSKAKELIVEFYPALLDLSAEGFRMLDKYSQMHHSIFLANFSYREKLAIQLDLE